MSNRVPKPLAENSNNYLRRLRIERISLGRQVRDNLIEERVTAYRERMRRRAKVDPVLVYYDGEDYFLKDGFLRVEAALSLGRKTILAEVISGTRAGMAAQWKRFLGTFEVKSRERDKEVGPHLKHVSEHRCES
jgi:hypothetical protein